MKKVNIFLMSILAICCAFVIMSPKSYQSSYAIGNDFSGVFVSTPINIVPKYTNTFDGMNNEVTISHSSNNYNQWYFQYRLTQSVNGLMFSYNNNTIYLGNGNSYIPYPDGNSGQYYFSGLGASSYYANLGTSFAPVEGVVYTDIASQIVYWFELSDTITGNVQSLAITYAKCYDIDNNAIDSRVPGVISNANNALVNATMLVHTIQYEVGSVRVFILNYDYFPTDVSYVFDSSMADSQYYQNGYNNGYSSGRTDGYNLGNSEGYDYGYQVGYNAGHTDGVLDSNDYSFIGLMGSVIDAPVSAVRGILNFNVLGVDISAFVFGLFTITIILVIIKKVKGM